jgi:hypothetical protein
VDALGIYRGNLWEQFQLGCHHFQTTEHQHPIGPDTKGWRNTSFPHGIVPVGRNLCDKKRFHRYEFKLACCKLPVHVYFSILWENRYKFFYAMICDEFIARVHFIIFRKECPRLSATAKKMISKVGHWYFEETSTYIRVFGATGAPHLLPVHVPDRLILGEICY